MVSVGNESQFANFCKVLGKPELAEDERFSKNVKRLENRDLLVSILEELLSREDGAYWSNALENAGVGCGPINDLAQALADPQVRHRRMQMEVPHPLSGTTPLIATPMRFSDATIDHQAPPTLGQHNQEILQGLLGLSDPDIADLAARGII